ncbi:class I SAM-dependent methyltransferase [Candidatus Saccharibacteria bacterium]|nr:class I SAM-dependent methyltransferase [Candidatus Saccharibacteria bacterium]
MTAWKNDQVSGVETQKIIEIAKKCLDFEGDYVELGCYKGDTSILLAEIVRGTGKKMWIYDSFEGLPEKTEEDISELGREFQKGVLDVTKQEVKKRFLKAGLPVPIIKKAWFKDLGEEDLPEKISFAFLDGDLYESIKESLKLIEKKMIKGGVVVIHDYNNLALPGVVRAVNEWANRGSLKVDVYQSLAIIVI